MIGPLEGREAIPARIIGLMGATSQWKTPPGWAKLREQVFRRDGHVCYRCGRYASTVDHVLAVALGGTHDLRNLRPACSRCNSSTGASLGNRLKPRTPPWLRGRPVARPRPRPMRSSRDW